MENTCRLIPLLKDLLDEEKIPSLKWVIKEQQIWQLPWKHHRPTKWGEPDAYMLCEIAKKMYNFRGHEPDPKDLKVWKERLRNALRSLGVKELEDRRQQDGENPIKVYQFSSDSGNGKRPRMMPSQRRGGGNSPPKVESCDNVDQLNFQRQYAVHHINDTIPHHNNLNSIGTFPSFRSRSPVHDFQDIDTDGFSGNLESVIPNGDIPNGNHYEPLAETALYNHTDVFSGNSEIVIPNGNYFNPLAGAALFNQAASFSGNSEIVIPNGNQFAPVAGNALISHETVTDFAAASCACIPILHSSSIGKCNTFESSKTCLVNGQKPNNGHAEIDYQQRRDYQLAICETRNIPHCILDSLNEDSNDSESQEGACNIMLEPSMKFNYPFDNDSLENPFISLSVNYMDKTVLSKRISDMSVRLCFIPDQTSRESITSCPISEQYGPHDAKLVALPHADKCPGLDRNYISVIQKILNHMLRGITITYKGDDIFAKRLCKAVPYYGIPQEKQSEKLQRDTEVKIFDFKSYFCPKLFEENVIPNPFVRLTFSVKNPDQMKMPPLSVDIWHMKANELVKALSPPKNIYSLEPDCSLSNEFDTRLKIEQNLKC
ncbi:hypothetical protein Btru_006080 [Bulinus truncatus]|nr:hypothetical protein Btru_006080 [Bulinus truncatus]